MKKPGFRKNSLMQDAVKRRALERFVTKSPIATFEPFKDDPRIGLFISLAWNAGYESARRRRTRS